MSQDFAKLRVVVEKVRPSVIFAQSTATFAKALDVVREIVPDAHIVDPAAIDEMNGAFEAHEKNIIISDHVAKILFTSGSTAFPKGVPNTHRMLCANQQMIAQLWAIPW